jgi:uncharacterized protein YraI
MKRFALFTSLALAAFLPVAAQAAVGTVIQVADLYAGPGNYPNIAAVPTGASVSVIGCTSSYHWCDVTFGAERGWIAGDHLALPYEGRPVTIIESGPRLSVPIVAFEINPYWEAHYRDRAFFSERQRWAQLRAEQRFEEEEHLFR